MKRNLKNMMYLAAVASMATLTGCHSSSSTTTTTVIADPCQSINGCVDTTTGFQFPDGNGGTVVCTNGNCVDSNPAAYNSGYNAGYVAGLNDASGGAYTIGFNDGYNAGTTDGYNTGYTAGSADGYNQGYSDGSTDGYNQGYSDGSNDGYNQGYSDGSTDGYNSGWSDGYNSGYSDGYSDGSAGFSTNSVAGQTRDPDLQRAELQQKVLNTRAQAIANQFQMSFSSAVQLTELADKVQKLAMQGKLTAADKTAVTQGELGIAGISAADVDKAILESVAGNTKAADDLMDKAAKNLGMSSTATLRDKLLPALGIQLN